MHLVPFNSITYTIEFISFYRLFEFHRVHFE
jgi:hypothetical protein